MPRTSANGIGTDAKPSKRSKSARRGRAGGEGRTRDAGHGRHGTRGFGARTALVIVLLAAWTFTLASLLGFHAGDPPSHLVWPHNEPVRNWCGPAGAYLAFHAIKTLGVGVWVVLLGVAAYLAAWVAGHRVTLTGLRAVGLMLLACGVSALHAIVLPSISTIPGLAGGLVGSEAAVQLGERFGPLGASLWALMAMLIGGIVAFDRWLILGPLWAFRAGAPAVKAAGGLAVATGSAARSAGGVITHWSSPRRTHRHAIRVNDIDDDPDIEHEGPAVMEADEDDEPAAPAAHVKIKRRKSGVERPGVAPPTSTVEHDEEAEPDASDDHDREALFDEDPADDGEVDHEKLREKISKLPIAFARYNRKVATDDDLRDLQGVGEIPGYRFPGMDLLENPEENFTERLEELVRGQAEALESALRQYKIAGEVVGIESGPVITMYNVRLAPGTKVAALQNVSSDIARSLKAVNIRIVSNMAGRDTVGIEVPNPTKERVRLKELMSKRESFAKMSLPMFLGKDASGEPLIADLTQMPHMLIAGTTGSGKSVCINTIIMGFMYTRQPGELKLVLVDPKMVELGQFKDIPHLMCPVVTEMGKAAAILEWACRKMDERYELLSEAGCRDIAAYNALPWDELRDRFNPQTPEEEARIPRRLPYMVFVIDELADLMMTAKEVEGSIIRIAQKARAVGIHLILATQRPQANVVTGLIKSNMPCRICFKVASGMDSRIVLDQKGGELLLGQGDMLYLSPRTSKLTRCQGTLVDDSEIRRVVKFMRDVAKPTFERQLVAIRTKGELTDEDRVFESANNASASLAAAQEDPLFDRAVEIVLETKRGSVSLLQRRLAIGYTRASRLIDLMGIAGIIGEHKGSVAREVAITPAEWEAMKTEAGRMLEAGEGPGQNGQGDLFAAEAARAPREPTASATTDDAIEDEVEDELEDASEEIEDAMDEALDEEADEPWEAQDAWDEEEDDERA